MPLCGQWGLEGMLSSTGILLRNTPFTILTMGGSNATVYTDITGGTGGSGSPYNPVNSDANGNLTVYAPPDRYQLQVGGVIIGSFEVLPTWAMVGVANGVAGLDSNGLLPAVNTRPVVAGLNIINPLASPYNAAGNGLADDTTPLTTALSDLHTSGGQLYLPSRSGFKTTATLNVTKPTVSIGGPRSSQATFLPAFNGDCLRIQMAVFAPEVSAGVFEGFLIDLTSAGAAATGLHIGDAMSGTLRDVRVQSGTGGSAVGIWFDNRTNYTERWQWEQVNVDNCTTCVLFDVNGAPSNSFGYHNIDKLHVVINSGQIGVRLVNGALIYNGHFGFTANCAAGSTAIQIDGRTGLGVTALDPRSFDIECEVTGGGSANAILLSEYGGISGNGIVDFSSGTFTCSNDRTSSGHPGAAALTGRIVAPGLVGTANLGSAINSGSHPSSSGKFWPITIDGTTYFVDLRT